MNGYYDLVGYHPGADFFAGAIEMQPHPDGEGGQLWHVTTPLGQLSPRAFALSSGPSNEEREAQVLAAYPSLRGDPHHDSRARR